MADDPSIDETPAPGLGGADADQAEEGGVAVRRGRDEDLLGRRDSNSKIRQHLLDLFDKIAKGFDDQSVRADGQEDYWDCYNCEINSHQFYNGDAQIFVPIIRDAINALVTRHVNQLFPPSGRYIEAVAADGKVPYSLIGLLDYYVRSRRLKTQVAKALCRNGYIEGQFNLYVDWAEVERTIVSRETHGPIIDMAGLPVEAPEGLGGEDIEDISEETIVEGMPIFDVLHDSDVLVLPATADSIDEALAVGGSVTIVRRWSKEKIEQMAEDGSIRRDEADDLIDSMGKVRDNQENIEKALNEHVGIRSKGTEAFVWESWHNLKISKTETRLCRIFFGPSKALLGTKRNPNWNDRCPLLSVPVEKVAGVFKGSSLVASVASIQYEANDAINQGADTAIRSALPIVVRDPEKGNGPFILNLAAIWDIPPDSIKFMAFPDLTPRAITRVQYCMQAIFQALGVNPAMLPNQTGRPGARRNQAEIAMELQVDIMSANEAADVLAEGIFTPLLGWMVDLDYQYRDRALTVRAFGEMGLGLELEEVAPLQNRAGFDFTWSGPKQARNAAQNQQRIAWFAAVMPMMEALKAQGYQLNPVPAIELSAGDIFDARTARLTIVDMKKQLTLNPELENELMLAGHALKVHPMDPDPEHMQSHLKAAQETGDPHGTIRAHIQDTIKSMQLKAMQQVMQQQQQAQGGRPGGRPSRAGAGPRPGAQPAGPRLGRGPPGTIHPDQMPRAGAVSAPRKT